ncbi:ABC transporter ATP-binding protein [Leptothoe kymatousa]|uniref:ABC transporter ATP-binding protein n=1 Tax=Leptothoe kymatousa TAU-MAC 1615 TaxID=2364775 RepID=A0ABS5Y514_9CYAN|nr:ABC transporter ATP-binding protein [Leptothoe kymatousa]MBT9312907.1 ABC transporter ATP-binding protein [Leptothoe kymatousa TAU-MAC 1615]
MAQSRLQYLQGYLRPHRQQLMLGVGALLLVNILSVWIPLIIGDAVERLKIAFSQGTILRYVVLILALATVMWAIRMASRVMLFGVGRKVEFDLKQRIFEHLLSLESAYFAENTIGDLINRATSDVDNIRRLLGFAVLSLANTLFAYTFTVPAMLRISVRLTLVALVIYPVMMFLVGSFSNRLRQQQLDVQQSLSDLSTLIQEDMSGIGLIKIYAQESNEQQAFAQRNHALLDANLALARTRNTLFPLLGGLASLSLAIILAVGARSIAAGTLAVGDFVTLLLYVNNLVFPTALLGFTITAYQRGEVSVDRIEAIFTAQPKVANVSGAITLPIDHVAGRLQAKGLTYQYPGTSTPAIENIAFTLEPGETVALVGPIGSGKSTLAKALPRILEISAGQLYIDGHDVTQVTLEDLRRAIAFVPQDSFLFSTKIKNNLRYGMPLAEMPEIEGAAKLAQIQGEILNFPSQYETLVGERGITLSGGQRQRTALGRALLIDAPILVLDDALSSVDNQTATQILDNLSQGTQRKTVIFITHQMSAAANCDRIMVMEKGKIVQTGTHDSLVTRPGLYQKLWNQHKLKEVLQ